MADVVKPAHDGNGVGRDDSAAGTNIDDLESLRRAAREIPSEVLKALLLNGVCARCIFRLLILHEQVCSRPSVATPILNKILHELSEHEEDGTNSIVRGMVQDFKEDFQVCRVCLGILQFVYNNDDKVLVKKNNANEFVAAIADVVKREGHQVDSFSLEVSLPSAVVDNDLAVWSYIKEKYGSQPWFQEKIPPESIVVTVKDFLKLSVASPLEKLLDVKSNESSFRIRLTYTLSNASAEGQRSDASNGSYKKRKLDDITSVKSSGGSCEIESHVPSGNSSIDSQDGGAGFLAFPIEKVNLFCVLSFQCYKTPIYVGGRYLKYSRNVSQTRWIIDDERMGEASVEEIVGGNILPICQGDSYKFHAAGREDIDVRMLGSGRPFLVEIQNARQFPSDAIIKDIEMKINSLESQFVRVKNLKFLGNQGWALMREGESEKQKQYAALVWISRPLNDEDACTLSSLKDMQILQKTPIRVLHRRSPLGREKTIHWMRIERIAGSSQYFMLHLCTQAGTYIKEFVHGDLGRTHPSVGSILGCRAEILQLDVTDVKMDCFQA
ncbi:Pseudouridine synthase family protein [Striga hermonthica]|uniref:tRNA pseudouridine(55) synthase n=1 Tax=Striga hermonthica TaxID=68872 RepID=A0A9N7MLI2_STRHE|nr:Pseudouridine synthase family protein [Striga hermonthica]